MVFVEMRSVYIYITRNPEKNKALISERMHGDPQLEALRRLCVID